VPRLKVLAFDAYGTIFDVHSVQQECDRLAPGKGADMSQIWRAKQLEYTWLRSLMGRYADFQKVTSDALAYTCERLGVRLEDGARKRLMDAYLHLAPFPDVAQALPKLGGLQRCILSNGSPNILEPLVRNTGLTDAFPTVLSVDAIGIYKPSPRVYQMVCDRYRVAAGEVGFISSNAWDAIGAKAFGFRVFWLNRAGTVLDHLDVRPDHVIKGLAELPGLL
jgi:2-haloacid dehalogenase